MLKTIKSGMDNCARIKTAELQQAICVYANHPLFVLPKKTKYKTSRFHNFYNKGSKHFANLHNRKQILFSLQPHLRKRKTSIHVKFGTERSMNLLSGSTGRR